MLGARFLDVDFMRLNLACQATTGYLKHIFCTVTKGGGLGNCIGTAMRDGGFGGGAGRVAGVRGGPQGGLFSFKFSSRTHPRKFGLKRFLAVSRSWRGSGVACFWLTSFRKKFIGSRSGGPFVRQLIPLGTRDHRERRSP